MSLSYESDEKKVASAVTRTGTDDSDLQLGTVEAALPAGVGSTTFLEKTRGWIGSIGAEVGGIERVPEEERTDQPVFDLATMFFAANCNVTTLATGYLGTATFGLGWWDSFLCIIFFNVISVIPPAFMATFGPKLGLRTMILPRYSFGWWPAKVLAFLNFVNQIGWGIVSAISGGGVLYDVGSGKLPLAAAVLIICVVGLSFGTLGYKVLHTFDRYSWIVMLICFIIVAGFGGKHFIDVPMGTGATERANVFAFGAVIIGYEVAWLPIAADYCVYMKSDTNPKKPFWWMLIGLLAGQLLIEFLGAAIGTLAFSTEPLFADAVASGGMGGLMGAVFEGYGVGTRNFGKFVEAVVAFSNSAVLSANVYSLALNVQIMSVKLMVIPRFVWSALGAAVLLVCAIVGRNVLSEVMTNFLSICTYWLVPFCTVILLEHFIWRRNYAYDLAVYEDPTRLPYGIAASVAFVVGTVISLLCMNQVWWVGPIALGIGPSPSGTDISWLLAMPVCTILYIPLRIWERRKWGV